MDLDRTLTDALDRMLTPDAGQHNTYDRETLYQEVWAEPVTEVAKRYGVSDVTIHKLCKSLDIPVPPRGYWTKVRAGKPATRIPLPKSKKPSQKTGNRTWPGATPKSAAEPLVFLDGEERDVVPSVARQIQIHDQGSKLHSKVAAHLRVVNEWNKKDTRQAGASRDPKDYSRSSINPPCLAGVVSKEALPRACRILDALIRTMEPLGCSVTDDLKFIIRGETVPLEVHEMQDTVDHVLTKQEEAQLREYEKEKTRYSWAHAPSFRKNDYVFNGRLSVCARPGRYIHDTDSSVVEDRLGDLLIDLFEASEMVRKDREAKEEAERRRQEEADRRERRRQQYNAEVRRTNELVNLAKDFDTACKIRAYVAALESHSDSQDAETAEWIDWAKKKAGWYDPTVARDDEVFGQREHEKSEAEKSLKEILNYWR
jgi:hypothetical protein